jgi:hypothetical protein
VYCPVKKEFTQLLLAKSYGMEVEVCLACNEPEPVLRLVSDVDLDVIAAQLDEDE